MSVNVLSCNERIMFYRVIDVNVSGCESVACAANGSSPFHKWDERRSM